MNEKKETKFLTKKQMKRNIQKQVNELLNELNWNETQPSTSAHSVIDTHLEQDLQLDQDLNLSLNDFRNNKQINESKDKETFNVYSEVTFEALQESYITEEHNSSEDEALISNGFLNKLRKWALINNITLSALDELLSLLREFHHNIPLLPLSGRSLLHTPKTTNSINLQNGKFSYFGIGKMLYPLLKKEPCSKTIDLDLILMAYLYLKVST